MTNTKIKSVTFKAWVDGKPKLLKTKGKRAKTLLALAKCGAVGITALELSNTWALRLSEYISGLRHKMGLDIEMIKEPHDNEGGWHGRYILITPVEILEIE